MATLRLRRIDDPDHERTATRYSVTFWLMAPRRLPGEYTSTARSGGTGGRLLPS